MMHDMKNAVMSGACLGCSFFTKEDDQIRLNGNAKLQVTGNRVLAKGNQGKGDSSRKCLDP